MSELPDAPQRLRALTQLDATLLVEAAAGTGKTSLLAGRVSMALITGTPPREVVAITFTQAAADELSIRIHRTYPLAAVAQAHAAFEQRQVVGRVLLSP